MQQDELLIMNLGHESAAFTLIGFEDLFGGIRRLVQFVSARSKIAFHPLIEVKNDPPVVIEYFFLSVARKSGGCDGHKSEMYPAVCTLVSSLGNLSSDDASAVVRSCGGSSPVPERNRQIEGTRKR